jgi:DNA-binding NarL/FixJ family response regulator
MTDAKLSPRETQVLQGMAEGLTLEFIAFQLGISVRTVKYYTQSLKRKLDAPSNACAVARAMQLGIIQVFYFEITASATSSG